MIPAFIGPLGWPELLVIGLLGVLIFGRRLPEVGRNVGRGIVEFKRGLSGLDDSGTASSQAKLPDQDRHDAQTQAHSPNKEAATTSSQPDEK